MRGCGLVVDLLKDRWLFASLVALDHEALSPAELLNLFESAHDANAPVFGPHSVYRELVTRRLTSLTKAGLIEPNARCGRRRAYRSTALGAELLASLQASGRWGVAHYEWLVTYSRIQRHLDVDEPIPGPDPADPLGRERMRRRSLALLYGELLSPKWTYATLVALAGRSLRFVEIITAVNAAVDASSDVVSGHLADPALSDRLDALQGLTLVDRVREFGRAHCYALTVQGRELVASLEPVAAFGIRRDAEMTAAVLAR